MELLIVTFCLLLMLAYCQHTGLRFKESMLKWEPGPIPEWDVWNGWHENALKSCGFSRPTSDQSNGSLAGKDIPKEVQKCIDECMTYYKFLYSRKTIPISVILH